MKLFIVIILFPTFCYTMEEEVVLDPSHTDYDFNEFFSLDKNAAEKRSKQTLLTNNSFLPSNQATVNKKKGKKRKRPVEQAKNKSKKRKKANSIYEYDEDCASYVLCPVEDCSSKKDGLQQKIQAARISDLKFLLGSHLIVSHLFRHCSSQDTITCCFESCNAQWSNENWKKWKKLRRELVNHVQENHQDFKDYMPSNITLTQYVENNKKLSSKVYLYTLTCSECYEKFSRKEAEGGIRHKMQEHLKNEHGIKCLLKKVKLYSSLTRTSVDRKQEIENEEDLVDERKIPWFVEKK